ncbi:MAG TPA: pyridoxal-phosphate dependent enzyme [Puia sp.]|nr:pyridoxal-phosphate dependent enzyme [Puia sp.]
MMNLNAVTIDSLHLEGQSGKNILVDVLRLDKTHRVISGNKWFKLKYYLEQALTEKSAGIITFGGTYSNHIVATACAAKTHNLKCIGFIRGEKPATLSHTLRHAEEYHMQLEFLSRTEYKTKNEEDFLQQIKIKFPGFFVVPEGGAGAAGIKGSSEIFDVIDYTKYSHFICAVGTGTTFAGIANRLIAGQSLTGICVLKGMHNILNEIKPFIQLTDISIRAEINHDYHFEGYAKKNQKLVQFMNSFFKYTQIPSDFVYTGKLFYATWDLLKKNHFPPGSKLLIIHSGGLQGNQSLPEGLLCY